MISSIGRARGIAFALGPRSVGSSPTSLRLCLPVQLNWQSNGFVTHRVSVRLRSPAQFQFFEKWLYINPFDAEWRSGTSRSLISSRRPFDSVFRNGGGLLVSYQVKSGNHPFAKLTQWLMCLASNQGTSVRFRYLAHECSIYFNKPAWFVQWDSVIIGD